MKRLLLIAVALAGCSRNVGDDRVCAAAPTIMSRESARDRAGSCVHRWAYRLARAPGTNAEIAEAAVTGCLDAIEVQANRRAAEPNSGTTAEAEYAAILARQRRLAVFHVITARAGNCEPV